MIYDWYNQSIEACHWKDGISDVRTLCFHSSDCTKSKLSCKKDSLYSI